MGDIESSGVNSFLIEAAADEDEREKTFRAAVGKIAQVSLAEHKAMHDPGGQDPKPFHNSAHPESMHQRAERLDAIFGLSEHRAKIVELAINRHDWKINYDRPDPDQLTAMLSRHRGAREGDKPAGLQGNESLSAVELVGDMEAVNRQYNQEIFTPDDIKIGRWSIEATYPDVRSMAFRDYPYFQTALQQNPALVELFQNLESASVTGGLLFFQPHLEQALEDNLPVPEEVLIVAMADLGAAGMGDQEVFFHEGNDEMRELYINLRQAGVLQQVIQDPNRAEDRKAVAKTFLGWRKTQPGFAAWQALRFEKIISLLKRNQPEVLPADRESQLRAQFSHYIDNTNDALHRYQQYAQQFASAAEIGDPSSLWDLAKTLGYSEGELGSRPATDQSAPIVTDTPPPAITG